MRLSDKISVIKGVGEKTAEIFSKSGIVTVGQLLYFFPRDYYHYPEISNIAQVSPKTTVIIKGKVADSPKVFSSKGKHVVTFTVRDNTGSLDVTYFGMPYMKKNFYPGKEVLLHGRCVYRNQKMFLSQPKSITQEQYEAKTGKLQPVYRIPKGLTNEKIHKMIKACLEEKIEVAEYLSDEILQGEKLMPIIDAIHQLHFPQTMDQVTMARQRLAFDEFYLFLLQLGMLKNGDEKKESNYVISESRQCGAFLASLPYELTEGQKSALQEIKKDMQSGYRMNRLVQGDVGCGKTILAFSAMLNVISAGYQTAFMAPTEVLARQHYEDICSLKDTYHLNVKPGFLSGSMTQKEKREIKAKIAEGEINFLVGTHALIQENVGFQNLALVVCDEQHRFGVAQRMKLSEKGQMPHILVMSATPIPRTLGLILYGDLDVSVIRELPASRKPIKNTVVGPEYRTKLYQFIMKQILEGRQAYIICPMVEENEDLDMENVTNYSEELKTIFPPSVCIEALHGKMKPKEKDEIMQRFSNNRIQILVSTTVVEVGVNVPNATVMMVENAERFGLSQLHQLRGRVGRGAYQSYCIFLIGNDSKKARDRLDIMAKTNDGFEIASEDLKQRGPGDFFGYRQAGMPGFQIADIYSDALILEQVKNLQERQSKEQLKTLYDSLIEKQELHFMNLHDVCL